MTKAGKNINVKTKTIISKGPLERVVVDGWELDNQLKEITGYSWVIDMVDHFSKFLISVPVKNNDSKNIEICLKSFLILLVIQKLFRRITEHSIRIV